MARKQFAGGAAKTTLSSGIASGDLALTVASGTNYPDGSVGPFVLVMGRETATAEKILCTSRTGNNFVVDAAGRGYDGTSAGAWSTGATVEHCLDATTLTDLSGHVYDTTRDDHAQYQKTDGTRVNTGLQAFSGVPGTTHESNRVNSRTQTYGRGVAVAFDAQSFQGGVTVGFSAAINRADPAASFFNNAGPSLELYGVGGVLALRVTADPFYRFGPNVSLPATNLAQVLGVSNVAGAPTGTPVNGGWFWVESGALKFKGSGGTVTTVAAA